MRWLVFVLVLLLPSIAHADEPHPKRLQYDLRVDGAVTATSAIWLLAANLLQPQLVPEKCRWCYRRANGDSALNVVDRSVRSRLKWDDTDTADSISSGLAFFFMPAASVGLPTVAAAYDKHLRYAPIDSLLISEATFVAADVNEMVKLIFARERPYVHYLPHLPDGIQGLTGSPSDANLSFYSGHTNVAFAMAASSTAVAFLRNYRLAPMVAGVQFASAVSVGYLRIAADKHYLSDVMVGAILGSLIGAGVPFLFHHQSSVDQAQNATSTTPQALGVSSTPLNFQGRW